MKIATFNINDVNKRLGNLIGWLGAEKPDVVALQELKAADREFPRAALRRRATAPCGAAKRPGTESPSWLGAARRS
jgi:exodeoxyribonuclease III